VYMYVDRKQPISAKTAQPVDAVMRVSIATPLCTDTNCVPSVTCVCVCVCVCVYVCVIVESNKRKLPSENWVHISLVAL
jgi:hypothetical protein